MQANETTSAGLILGHLDRTGWATPAGVQRSAQQAGVNISRQALMVSFRNLLAKGALKKVGHGAYARPGFAASDELRAQLRAFILSVSRPKTIMVPSKTLPGKHEPFEQWHPQSPKSLVTAYMAAHLVELPAAFFERELAELVAQGLMKPADLGPNIKGFYWTTPRGTQTAALLD